MSLPDRRLTPCRDDLAAAHLKGSVTAPRYAEAEVRRVIQASVPLRRAPDAALGYETELVFGELFDVYEIAQGWAWGQARRDGYVGYLEASVLAPAGPAATHKLRALRSFLYPMPGIKVTPLGFLPFGAEVVAREEEGAFTRTPEGYIYSAHLAPLGVFEPDPVAVAERMIGAPYLWGGKSSLGLDCSALVQTACHACGIAALRDSDMQEKTLGEAILPPHDAQDYQRGDLLFWPGHVAMAQGNGLMIHANAHFMAVTSEPLGPALARIAAKGDALRTVRRLRSRTV
jgi:Bacterial dipeptidyl-peptidase Sh3 domain/NlpC/P60 family